MVTTNPVVNELRNLISQLRSQRAIIEKEFQERLTAIEQKIADVETTLALYSEGRNIAALPLGGVKARDIAGKNHIEALITIAKGNNSMVKVTEATRLFMEARLSKMNRRSLSSHIHHKLSESDLFEYVSPGTFRLLAPEAEGSTIGSELSPRPENGQVDLFKTVPASVIAESGKRR